MTLIEDDERMKDGTFGGCADVTPAEKILCNEVVAVRLVMKVVSRQENARGNVYPGEVANPVKWPTILCSQIVQLDLFLATTIQLDSESLITLSRTFSASSSISMRIEPCPGRLRTVFSAVSPSAFLAIWRTSSVLNTNLSFTATRLPVLRLLRVRKSSSCCAIRLRSVTFSLASSQVLRSFAPRTVWLRCFQKPKSESGLLHSLP